MDRTECNTEKLRFDKRGKRRVEADFQGGRLVSNGGLPLMRQVDRRLGLSDAMAGAIHDPRDPAKVQHEQRAMIAQRIHALAAGDEDLNDHHELRHDPAVQLSAEVDPVAGEALASPSTLCRLENRITRADCVRLSEGLVDQFIASFDEPPERLTLDFDATDDPLHGEQEGRFYHGYYRCYCYLPLYVFCGPQLLVAYQRRSNQDPARHTRAVLKLLVDKLQKAFPAVRIVMRGDGGFCRWRLMRWCERHGIGYILGLAKNQRLKPLSDPFMEQAEADYEKSGEKQRQFHELIYAAGTWDRPRRVIVKAERLEQGPNRRFVVTNLDGDAQELYDQRYCARGEMENRIKEQQLDLFADRTSCREMIANQFRLLLSAAASVLIETFRRLALSGTELAAAQAGTIRLKLIRIAARVVVSARRVMFHLSSTHPMRELFRRIAQRLNAPVAYDDTS